MKLLPYMCKIFGFELFGWVDFGRVSMKVEASIVIVELLVLFMHLGDLLIDYWTQLHLI